MKHVKTGIALLLVLAFGMAFLSGCSEEGNEAGELSDYDSEAFIPVGTPGDDPSDSEAVSHENSSSGQSNGGAAGTVSGEGTQSGGFVVKDKKYDYEGNNLVVLNVENQTDKNYIITINGQYLDENGAVLKEESKTYEGFAAGWNNNFFFAPEIPFARFTYTLDAEEYDGECYAQELRYIWRLDEYARGLTQEELSRITIADEEYNKAIAAGRTDVPVPEIQYSPCIGFSLGFQYASMNDITAIVDLIVLDSQGEVILVQPKWFNGKVHHNEGDTLWKSKYVYFFPDPDNWEWPEEWKGDLTVLVSITDTYLYGSR